MPADQQPVKKRPMDDLEAEVLGQLRAIQAQISALQGELETFDESAAKAQHDRHTVIDEVSVDLGKVERATIAYNEPPKPAEPTPRMENFSRTITDEAPLFETEPTREEAENGRVRYALTPAEQVAYPMPNEVIGKGDPLVTVASVFVDFRTGIYQDLRQGNVMFPPVALPKDNDPLINII